MHRSPNIVRVIKSRRIIWADHLARMEILAGKPIGKRPLRRLLRRWEYNIGMDLKEIGINTRNWVDSAQDTDYWRSFVNAALNLRVP